MPNKERKPSGTFFNPRPRWIWWLRVPWLVIASLFILFSVISNLPAESAADLDANVHIYNGARNQYAVWERKEAIKFGLEQTATSIKFIFVAAAAILGFLSKSLIEPLLNPDNYVEIPEKAFIFFRHSALQCCISLLYGFIGYTYFIYLPVSDSFSVFGDVGNASNCQQLSLLIAAIFMLVGINQMWKNRSPNPGLKQKGEPV